MVRVMSAVWLTDEPPRKESSRYSLVAFGLTTIVCHHAPLCVNNGLGSATAGDSGSDRRYTAPRKVEK